METARLTIHRDSPADEGERMLFVSLDGERLGALGFRRDLARDIVAGPHHLRVHNTFAWKTVDFEAQAGEDVHFTAVNITPGCMVGIAAALGAAPMFVKVLPGRAETGSSSAGSTLG